MQNAHMEHSAVLLTCIKIPNGFQTFVLSIFEWLLKTGFTVFYLFDEPEKNRNRSCQSFYFVKSTF